jgi:hypothetical protein
MEAIAELDDCWRAMRPRGTGRVVVEFVRDRQSAGERLAAASAAKQRRPSRHAAAPSTTRVPVLLILSVVARPTATTPDPTNPAFAPVARGPVRGGSMDRPLSVALT